MADRMADRIPIADRIGLLLLFSLQMFTFTDLSCYIIKNYFQLTSTSMQLAILNHAVRRIYIYSTTFYRSLH